MVTKKILKSHKEWLANRTRIGGSEAAAIIGMNPYQTNVDLYHLKVGEAKAEDISDKPYIIYGNKAEPLLREFFKLDHPELEVFYEENNMFFNEKYEFAHASLDGWTMDKDGRLGVLEFKTTEIMNSNQLDKWKDRVPDNYYIQVLHYMMVLEADYIDLVAQLKWCKEKEVYKQTKEYHIERTDVEDDLKFLEEAEAKFWNENIIKEKCPSLILPTI